jgi:hypothetical protein
MNESEWCWFANAIEPPIELADGWEGQWVKRGDEYGLQARKYFPEGPIGVRVFFSEEVIRTQPTLVTETLNREAAQLMKKWPTPKQQWDAWAERNSI